MHQRQRRYDARVLQVAVVGADLRGQQHAFVDDGARGHRRHEKFRAVCEFQCANRMAGAFADDVELAFQCVSNADGGAAADEHLTDHRLDLFHRLAEIFAVHRHIAPAEQNLSFVLDGAFDFVFAGKA